MNDFTASPTLWLIAYILAELCLLGLTAWVMQIPPRDRKPTALPRLKARLHTKNTPLSRNPNLTTGARS